MSGDLREILEANLSKGPIGHFDVTEWGKTIYVFPYTLAQRMAVRKEATEEERVARLVQVRSKDEEGKNLFNESDYDAMLKLETGKVVGAIADKIVSFDPDEVSIEEAKN